MRYRIISLAAVLILLISCGFRAAGAKENKEPAFDPVLSARLENMLDHNYIYGDDFADINRIVDGSIPALLDKREDDFIKYGIVDGFVRSMYGVSAENYRADERFPVREGYFYIVPKGYSLIDHKLTDIEEKDGMLSVHSIVTVSPHDGASYMAVCETVFKENPDSAFGFNIISSVIY